MIAENNKNPIMNDYSIVSQINEANDLIAIEVNRGISSYFPIFISLGITLYGFFLFLQTIADSKSVIYGTLIFLGTVLIYIESHRAGLLSDYLGSLLENLVSPLVKVPFVSLLVAITITVLFIGLDTWGAMQSADSIERMLVNGIVKNSEQYKIAKSKAESGAKEAQSYQTQLKLWRAERAKAYNDCDKAWRLPTYRTKNTTCRDKFSDSKPIKTSNISGEIEESKYNEMEAQAKLEVKGYRKWFFVIFLLLSVMLNYFAVSVLFNQYRRKDKELTVDVIEELSDRMELMNAEKLNKLSKSTEVQKIKLEEKNIIDVELERETYNIVLAKKIKALERKRKIPLKIANNEQIMQNEKAGFVANPFHREKQEHKQVESKCPDYVQEEINGHLECEKKIEPLYNPSPKTDIEMLNELFKDGEVKKGKKLAYKTDIVRPHTKGEDKAFRKLCKDLRGIGAIVYRPRQGYYALSDYEDVKSLYSEL